MALSNSPAAGQTSPLVMRIIGAVALAHLINDLIQSVLPAIYPMLKANYDLSFAQIGMITLTFQITASLLQPWVGFFTDRRPTPNLLPLGTLCTLVGIVMLAFVGSFPMILEIHGGPYAMYGPFFASEIQRFAAEGYVTVWTNPRGSTGYGEDFALAIDRAYPGHDYDDLMSGVDALISKGYIDTANLFVTGGSGGGVLTAWIVGKTDRFKAAVVAKPVINWYSFVLYADNPVFFTKYWFGKLPWEDVAYYHRRSPISLVGNVKTPTIVAAAITPLFTFKPSKASNITGTNPRTMFGIVVVAVLLMLVPNCSAPTVTNMAQ